MILRTEASAVQAARQKIQFAKAAGPVPVSAGGLGEINQLRRWVERFSESATDAVSGRRVAILPGRKAGEWSADCIRPIGEFPYLPSLLSSWAGGNQDQARELLRGEPAILECPGGSLLVLPIVSRAGLESLLCVELDGQAAPLTLEQRELLRRIGRQAGDVIAELQDSRASQASALERRLEEIQKALAELTAQREQLERCSQMRSYVLSNTIHELRTPLVAIRGYARMLLEERAGPVSASQRQYLKIVFDNATKMAGLLRDLQNLPRPSQFRLETFDLRELWQQSLRPFRASAAQKSVAVIERVADQPLTITGDSEKLGLVLQRLLSNAIKFTSPGGEIRADLRSEPDQAVIRISDTGHGMPSEFTDEIFNPCENSSAAAAAPIAARGGEGPAIHEIVRLHGGRISVTSALGEGCMTVLALPMAHSTAAEVAA